MKKYKLYSINPKSAAENFEGNHKSANSVQGMVWNEMEDDFSIFHTGNFLPFYTKLFFHIPIGGHGTLQKYRGTGTFKISNRYFQIKSTAVVPQYFCGTF